MTKLVISSSPHLRDRVTTRSIMQDVCIALCPAALASILLFGYRSAILMAVSIAACVLTEWVCCKAMRQKVTTGDFSAVVTGLLLAMNLPANAPVWMPVIGAVVAIALVKMLFGGIGQNFMNPALLARAVLALSWATIMTKYPKSAFGSLAGVDGVSGATPLAGGEYSVADLFLGNVPGVLGETCKLALLIGAAYLLYKQIISWHIPVAFIAAFAVCYLIGSGFDVNLVVRQILSGGLILGAFFMATDYSTSPTTDFGKLLFGAGCGILLFIFRFARADASGFTSEWCSFAILLMNVVSPLIERITMPKSFGEVRGHE